MVDWQRFRLSAVIVSLGAGSRTDARRQAADGKRGHTGTGRPRPAAMVMLLVVFMTGSAAALFANGGFVERRSLEQRRDAANIELDQRLKRVHGLRYDVEQLQRDSLARERLAREELGYSRRGEMIFLLAEPPAEKDFATP